MKLMFVSDIHGSGYYCKEALRIYEEEKCDQLILLGDLLYHGPRNNLPKEYDPKLVAQLLNENKDHLITVRGNCDAEVDQMMLEFPALADYAMLLVDGHRFYITHGHHYNKDALPPLSKNDILCYGHFHVPLAYKQDDIYIFNPSSISLPKAGTNSYGIYENHTLTIKNLDGTVVQQITLDK